MKTINRRAFLGRSLAIGAGIAGLPASPAGVALAAGGFTTAALAHVMHREEYHAGGSVGAEAACKDCHGTRTFTDPPACTSCHDDKSYPGDKPGRPAKAPLAPAQRVPQ
jgi:hypothetical protein